MRLKEFCTINIPTILFTCFPKRKTVKWPTNLKKWICMHVSVQVCQIIEKNTYLRFSLFAHTQSQIKCLEKSVLPWSLTTEAGRSKQVWEETRNREQSFLQSSSKATICTWMVAKAMNSLSITSYSMEGSQTGITWKCYGITHSTISCA